MYYIRKITALSAIAVSLTAFAVIGLHCQNESDTVPSLPVCSKYGILFSYNLNYHSTDLRRLPGIPDTVPWFAGGSQTGFSAGAFYEHYFSERFCLMLRAVYSIHEAEISGKAESVQMIEGGSSETLIEHTLNADISSIMFEPVLKYYVWKRLFVLGGIGIGARIGDDFTHKEKLLQPSGSVFENGSTVRYTDTDLERESIRGAFMGGIGYDIPINYNGTILVGLEAVFSSGYADIAKDLTWDVNSLKIGINLKYSPAAAPKKEDKKEEEKPEEMERFYN